MEHRDIYITQFDLNRLTELLEVGLTFRGGNNESRHLESLKEELDRAHVVLPKDIPPDIVTMNSRVLLKELTSERETEITIAYPQDADIRAKKVSVLSTIGVALLGCREGDIASWRVPSGIGRFQVVKVLYQPEAEGHYSL